MEQQAKKTSAFMAVAVISVFLLQQLTFIVTPALASFAEYYVGVDYATILLISTMANIGSPIGSLVSGAVAGKRVNYKTIAIISAILVLASGVAPYFLGDNMAAILACRFIFGFGFGISLPVSNMFILGFWEGTGRDRMLGISTLVTNLSGVVYQLIAGWVCVANVQATWLVHAFALIPLLFIFFLKEPPHPEEVEAAAAAEADKNTPMLPARIIAIIAGYVVLFMFFYPALLNTSVILSTENLGDAGVAGIIAALYTVGGMIGGAIFPALNKALGKMIIPVLWIVLCISMALGAFGHSAVLLGACILLGGLAFYGAMPAVLGLIGVIVPPRGQALATSIFWAALTAFGFVAGVWMTTLTSVTGNADPRFPIIVGMVGCIVITVIWFVAVLGRKSENA